MVDGPGQCRRLDARRNDRVVSGAESRQGNRRGQTPPQPQTPPGQQAGPSAAGLNLHGPTMTLAYIGLGANLGNASASLRQAAASLAALRGISALTLSRLYRRAPVASSGPGYVHAVAPIETNTPTVASRQRLWQYVEIPVLPDP